MYYSVCRLRRRAFIEKLRNRKRKWQMRILICFACLYDIDDEIRDEEINDLGTLQTPFKTYFPEISIEAFTLARDQFHVAV